MHVTFYCIAESLLPHIHYISGRMRPMKILCTTPTTSGSHYIWPSLLFSSTFQDTSGSRWREGSWSSLEKAQLQGTSFHIYETSIMLQGYKLGLSWAKLIKFSAHARGWDIWFPPENEGTNGFWTHIARLDLNKYWGHLQRIRPKSPKLTEISRFEKK